MLGSESDPPTVARRRPAVVNAGRRFFTDLCDRSTCQLRPSTPPLARERSVGRVDLDGIVGPVSPHQPEDPVS